MEVNEWMNKQNVEIKNENFPDLEALWNALNAQTSPSSRLRPLPPQQTIMRLQ